MVHVKRNKEHAARVTSGSRGDTLVNLDTELRQRRNERSAPQMLTPARALAKKSLDAAVKRARKTLVRT